MKNCLVLICLLFFGSSSAQLLLNGANFIATNSSIVYVNNDSLLIENNSQLIQNGFLQVDKDLVNNNGLLQNDGDIYIYQDVLNNDTIDGLSNLSNFYITGDWINNNHFNPGLSTVTLNGNTQEVTGTEITRFYNLRTLGSLSDQKRLSNVNAIVLSSLDLGDVEFATNEFNLSILNASTNSILRNTGFVSSLDTGKLERASNSTAIYLFPTGSTNGTTRYRPIEITPNSSDDNLYGVRLANLDATIDTFDVLNLSDSLCAVNPDFYHRIYANSGSADISMFYIPGSDGDWNTIGNWQSTDLWDGLSSITNTVAPNFSVVTAANVNDFTEPAFALALEKPALTLDDFADIQSGESVLVTPIYSGSTPASVLWSPLTFNSCPSCLETSLNPVLTTEYFIEVNVNENCAVSDSILIRVKPQGLLLPTAFSPNFDGVNDYLIPLNQNIESYSIRVYNRWGELIYKSNDLSVGWDGTYNGKSAELGVYTYSATYKNIGFEEEETESGNITIIR